MNRRLVFLYSALLIMNLFGWVTVLLVARSYPLILGLATLAYGLGLRHAVDPDHIAAIDNSTRKLVQDGQRPAAGGFFFSLGHSTVVVLLTVAVALAASAVHHDLPALQHTGSVIGTSVSCLFLLLIGGINLVALVQAVKKWRAVLRGEPCDEDAIHGYPIGGGLLARLFRSLLRTVGASWHMYPIGFLFGLGFDTASEVALLGLAATSGTSGLPLWGVLLLPLLFTAGMSLVDTTDGVLMLRAYGWAAIRPARKLYYNMSITAASVLVALFIGGAEGLQVVQQEAGFRGEFWNQTAHLQLNSLGFVIVGAFVGSWLLSVAIYRLRRYDLIDTAEAK